MLNRKPLISLILILSFVVAAVDAATTINAYEVITLSTKKTKLPGYESLNKLIITDNKGNHRIRTMATVAKTEAASEIEKRLIHFLSPQNIRGTKFLTIDYADRDDDLWIYLPSLGKSRRIVAGEKSGRFMGSEFSYAEVTTFAVDDFKYTYLGDENLNEETCWKILMIPKTRELAENYGFSKKIVLIAHKDHMIRKAEYYDQEERLHRVNKVLKIRYFDSINKCMPTHMEIVNYRNGRSSELIIEKIDLNSHIDDEYFSQRYLER